jgi:transmembrane sensor
MNAPDDRNIGPEFNATSEESRAAEWVAARRNQKDWTDECQAELDAWLAKSLAHRVAFIRIDATWRRTDRLAALRKPMREPEDSNVPRRGRWMRIASVLGVVAISSVVAANYFMQHRSQLIQTPKGGQERLTLSDGSQIELNTDSAVLIDLHNSLRAVELVRGEAFFQIKHDTSRPFVVTAGTRRIVDLGTKFLVRMSPDSLNVILVEGKARLEGANTQRAAVLLPGDVAIATAYATKITRKSVRELSESLAWQHGAVVFHNERLADAVAELNRYGGPQLIVADSDSAKLAINGTFLTNNAEEFAGIAHELFGLRVERRSGNLILSR